MSKRYTFSKSMVIDDRGSVETLTAVEFDSFDEAIKAVEKGMYDRKLELKNKKDE